MFKSVNNHVQLLFVSLGLQKTQNTKLEGMVNVKLESEKKRFQVSQLHSSKKDKPLFSVQI